MRNWKGNKKGRKTGGEGSRGEKGAHFWEGGNGNGGSGKGELSRREGRESGWRREEIEKEG